jgi:hypothetical protein
MAYEPKPGQFTLFKNDRKEKDSHPDYKGDGMDLDGNPVWVSAWIKSGNKGKFMSCSMQPKEAAKPASKPAARSGGSADDDIPFAQHERGWIA